VGASQPRTDRSLVVETGTTDGAVAMPGRRPDPSNGCRPSGMITTRASSGTRSGFHLAATSTRPTLSSRVAAAVNECRGLPACGSAVSGGTCPTLRGVDRGGVLRGSQLPRVASRSSRGSRRRRRAAGRFGAVRVRPPAGYALASGWAPSAGRPRRRLRRGPFECRYRLASSSLRPTAYSTALRIFRRRLVEETEMTARPPWLGLKSANH
jgi:hypothetical protein